MFSRLLKILLAFVGSFVLLLNTVVSQNIPKAYLSDWQYAGLSTEFGQDFKPIRLSDLGIRPNTNLDCSTRLQQIIDSLSGTACVLLFDTGQYLFHNTLFVKENTILRGRENEKVVFNFDLGGQGLSCIVVSSAGKSSSFYQLNGSVTLGSTQLELPLSSQFYPGDFAEIIQTNGAWDIKPAEWAGNVVGQLVQIEKVEGNKLFLKHPLRIDFEDTLEPRIRSIQPISNVGIEQIVIHRKDRHKEYSGYNILFDHAVNCYVRSVESNYSQAAHVMISQSSNIEISGCFIHNAFCFDGKNTQGYGVCVNHHSGECLIENNIFENLRHAMMVKAGANGNVFIYNFSTHAYRDEFPHDASGDISLHGHYAFANLFEGNIAENIIIDHYWGPSGPGNMLFRNRLTSYGIVMTKSQYETRNQAFVGNEITNEATFYGLYFLTGSGHFQYGNNIRGVVTPGHTDSLTKSSLYYKAAPWYFKNYTWPAIGLPNGLNANSLPAKDRYESGIKTIQKHETLTGNNVDQKSIWDDTVVDKIYPNPFQNLLKLEFTAPLNESVLILMYDLKGAKKMEQKVEMGERVVELQMPASLPSGYYFVNILGETIDEIYKIAK